MNLDSIAAIAGIVSSVAIVATLAYLAVQSRQANSMLLGNSRQAAMSTDVALLTAILANADTASRILGSDPEEVKSQALLIIFMRSREFQWLQFRAGTLDRQTLESYMSPVNVWLTAELGAAWWASNRRNFDPDFVAFVDAWIAGRTP